MEKSDFENLEIWQKGMDMAEFCLDITERLSGEKKHYRLIEQLESSSLGVPQNIAEGKGRYSKNEFLQFLYYARGLLYESITLIKIFSRKKWINQEEYAMFRKMSHELS